jgi:hypothetical protein
LPNECGVFKRQKRISEILFRITHPEAKLREELREERL